VSRKRKPAEVVAEGSGELDVRAIEEAISAEPEPADAALPSEPSEDTAATSIEPEAGVEHGELAAESGEDEGAEGADLPAAAADMAPERLRRLVEALIFASDKPVTVARLRQLTRVGDVRRIEQALAELADEYRDRGIALQQVSGGYQMRTNPQYSAWVQHLIAGRPVRLSRAQLETLAIIAYRQPITRPEIDEIRGVDSSNTLRVLTDRALIRVLGKKEEVGRPLLYGTTKEFLDFFSLADLRELPTLREYSELTAESRRVMSDRLGLDLDAPAVLDPGVVDPALAADGARADALPAEPFVGEQAAADVAADSSPPEGPAPEARGPDLE
jgi:segregation and condensation protein B